MKIYFSALIIGLLLLIATRSSAQQQSPAFRFNILDAQHSKNPVTLTTKAVNKKDVVHGLPPNIVYPTPQTYLVNSAISPLNPVNNGGVVSATAPYGKVTTIAGSNSVSYFLNVTGVAVDGSGNIFAAVFSYNEIAKITPTGAVSTFAGGLSFGYKDGQGSAASFAYPDALVFDQGGNLFVADNGNNAIRKITPDGQVSTFAGNTVQGATDGNGVNATFYAPRGLAFDASGNLFVADQGNNLIRKITPAGIVSTYAGNGSAGFNNGQRSTASFNTPTAVAVDASGNLYVSDAGNNAIRKVAADGTVSTYATAGLSFPRELRLDANGNLYENDMGSYSVKKISPTGVITTIAGSGNSGSNDGIGTNASFSQPIGMDRDANGDLIIGDLALIRRVSLSGYTIDKPLPAGLNFDGATGMISGTPTALSVATNYTITAYNGYGSSSTVINLAVSDQASTTNLLPSVITLPPQQPGMLGAGNYYDPQGTSTNNETPITYTTSDPTIAYITADGRIKVIKPGTVTITANQAGDADYYPAAQVSQQVNFIEYFVVNLPSINNISLCTADFTANGTGVDVTDFPLSYTSSNPAVATVDNQGNIHLTGTGTTTITLYENGLLPYYVAATPQSQTFTVTTPVTPGVNISALYSSPCLGSPVTFTAAPQNAGNTPAYQWQVNGMNDGTNNATFTTASLHDGDKVSCMITNTDNACISTYIGNSNIIAVSLITPSFPSVSITASKNLVFAGTPITFTATVAGAKATVSYQWLVNGSVAGTDAPTFSSSTLSNNDVITCTVSSTALCSTPAVSNPLQVSIVTDVTVPNTFTPNGDGINDQWVISGIGSFPNCLVSIYNRYGNLIYESKGYPRPWDGTISGRPVRPSTYYYVIRLELQDRIVGGYVTVLR